MKNILRLLISGLVAALITAGIVQVELLGIIPATIKGTLNWFYINKELIIFILSFGLMFFSLSIPLANKITSKIEYTLNQYPMQEILMYIIGLGIGLYVANLISDAIKMQTGHLLGQVFILLLYVGLG